MKIIVTELYSAKGHKNLFINICKLLRVNYDVIAVVPRNSGINIDGVKVIVSDFDYYDDVYERDTSLNRLRYGIKVARVIKRISKLEQIKRMLCVTYDEKSYALLHMAYFSSFNVYLIHNNNIDNMITSKYASIAFRCFNNRISHIVLAGFIKRGLIERFGINPNKIIVLPHPATLFEDKYEIIYDCVGISNGNDESLIKEFIRLEEEEKLFSNNHIHIVLKSKIYKYESEYLQVFNGYLADSEYNRLINSSQILLMPFPLHYKYRMSGTLVDAIVNKKKVISTDIPLICEASKVYPNCISIFNLSTFVESIKKMLYSTEINDFHVFEAYHDEDLLSAILCQGISSIEKEISLIDNYDF